MKIYKKKYVSLGIIFLICLYSISAFITFENSPIETEIQENPLPKLSDGEIDIITPENKTYTKAMSGYYPATYGFEHDVEGSNPVGWILSEPLDTSGQVISELDDHKKILELYDNSNTQYLNCYNTFLDKTSGTIEFYFRVDDSGGTDNVMHFMLNEGGSHIIWLRHLNGGLLYRYPSGWKSINSINIDTWYYVRIDFECDAGGYKGLSADKVDIYINDVIKVSDGDFTNPSIGVNKVIFATDSTFTDDAFHCYIDAIGYSWDENYDIGDNLDEGLLLSFENSTTLDWMGYSLDNAANKTILGNSTIPVPHNGTHSIQVFGNETLGTMYESEKSYFTMDYIPINILTPENKTYTEPMSGFYPATYGFENDAEYSNPSGWTTNENLDYIVDVIDEKNEHKKVVKFYDDDNANYALLYKVFDFQVSGTLEWYAMASQTNKKFYMGWLDAAGTTYAFMVSFYSNGYITYNDGSHQNIMTYSANNWYHFKIEFECGSGGYKGLSADTYNLYINGDKKLTGKSFWNMGDGIKRHTFFTDIPEIGGQEFYIDALGVSWDPYYETGDNLNEGILLNFETSSLEKMSYSLNGQSKRSILGNTTLPIPDDGSYRIQVFGKDSLDNLYESDLRYYEIDIGAFVKWHFPNENQLVILPPGDAIFNFRYTYRKLEDVTLEINGTDFGSVWGLNSTILSPYTIDIDGPINATLWGYEEGNPITPAVSDSRNFTFSKLTVEVYELLDYGTEFLGEQLYLILHDPHGDNSFSGFSETTGLSIGLSSSFTRSVGFELGLEVKFPLFSVGYGASTNIQSQWSTESQYEYKVTDTTALTSSLDSSNKDFIGPGYGDRYWGEASTYSWELKAYHREYFNGTIRYEQPKMYWGIIRSGEVILSDYNAPQEWRDFNPVHNNWQNVNWIDSVSVDGGGTYSYTRTTATSQKRIESFQISLDSSVSLYLGPVDLTFSLDLEFQTQKEFGQELELETSYTIYDDESTDHISQQYGIDTMFSTIIFKSNPLICKTSKPLENNTFDYVPPLIEFPEIELDSSGDGFAPCQNDSPIITVDISDEGGIQSALVMYSFNDGANWDSSILSEQMFNPGTWECAIPALVHGTSVLWYIRAWDLEGSYSSRKDPRGDFYGYTVINRMPTVAMVSPNGGETFTGNVNIIWSASDSDGDDVLFSIAYNIAGTGWVLLESNISEYIYNWDISNIPYSNLVLVKVIVNDGYGGEVEDSSDFVFTIGVFDELAANISEFPFSETLNIITLVAVGAIAVIVLKKPRSLK